MVQRDFTTFGHTPSVRCPTYLGLQLWKSRATVPSTWCGFCSTRPRAGPARRVSVALTNRGELWRQVCGGGSHLRQSAALGISPAPSFASASSQRAQKLGLRFSPIRLFQKSFKRRFSRCQFSSTIFRMIVLRMADCHRGNGSGQCRSVRCATTTLRTKLRHGVRWRTGHVRG